MMLTLVTAGVGAFFLCQIDVYQKSDLSAEAVYKIPESSMELVLERRLTHLFLGEYERILILREGNRELLRQGIASDTGGYSRMCVYKTSSTEYYLRGMLDFDKFILDLSGPAFRKLNDKFQSNDSRFIGCFDRDPFGWRFIPAKDQPRQRFKPGQNGVV